jgi:hypothetical protein
MLTSVKACVKMLLVAGIPTFRLRSPVMAYSVCLYLIKGLALCNILYAKVVPGILGNNDFVSVVMSWLWLIGLLSSALSPILMLLDIRGFVAHMKEWLQFQVSINSLIIIIIIFT